MSRLSNKLELLFNKELIRRLLIKYFNEKGVKDNFDIKIYPLIIQDLTESVPELFGKVEIIPHAINLDPQTGSAKIGWNLFVLGNQRMYLGETEHSNMANLASQISSGSINDDEEEWIHRNGRSPRDIIKFISRILGNSTNGIISHSDVAPSMLKQGSSTGSEMFERPRTIRPEKSSSKF